MAYISNYTSYLGTEGIVQCAVGSDGGLSNCVLNTPLSDDSPTALTLDPAGQYVYAMDGVIQWFYQCPVDQTTGLLSSACTTIDSVGLKNDLTMSGVTINDTNTMIYLTARAGSGQGLYQCPITTVAGVSTVGTCMQLFSTSLFGTFLLNY